MPSADTNLIISKIAAHDKKLDKLVANLSSLAIEVNKITNSVAAITNYVIRLNAELIDKPNGRTVPVMPIMTEPQPVVDPPRKFPTPILPPDTVIPIEPQPVQYPKPQLPPDTVGPLL